MINYNLKSIKNYKEENTLNTIKGYYDMIITNNELGGERVNHKHKCIKRRDAFRVRFSPNSRRFR